MADSHTPAPARLQVRGGALEARWWGPPDAALTFVLLHEGLGSVSLWKGFPAALSAVTRQRVMAFSRRGHGASDPPREPHSLRFMHEEAIDELPAVLDAAGIDHAVLLGHSDGGSIAIIFAATYPQRVDALILEAPHVFVEDLSIASIERITREYREGDLRRRLARHHTHVDHAFRGWSDVWLHDGFRQWNTEEYLPRVIAPTLLIQGEDDEYGTLAQVRAIEHQVAGRPVETVTLPGCGHSPHRDRPDEVLTAIGAFVARALPVRSTAE